MWETADVQAIHPFPPNHQASCVTFLIVVLMRSRNSGSVFGSGGTQTLSLTKPHWKKSHTAIGNVTQDMLERVWQEWEYRLDVCCVTLGAHIESI